MVFEGYLAWEEVGLDVGWEWDAWRVGDNHQSMYRTNTLPWYCWSIRNGPLRAVWDVRRPPSIRDSRDRTGTWTGRPLGTRVGVKRGMWAWPQGWWLRVIRVYRGRKRCAY